MANTAQQLAVALRSSGTIGPSDIVRLTGNGLIARADASSAANVANTLGVAQITTEVPSGAPVPIATAGAARVRLETGLAPTAGDLVYVSATNPGAGTVVEPAANGLVIGSIVDANGYSSSRPYVTIQIGQVIDATTTTNNLVADWPIGSVRYFAVDYDGGDDSNRGWSDTSAADAGVNAVKTWEQLRLILPSIGAGRIFRIFVKPRANGATYLNKDGTEASLNLVGLTGYSTFSVLRATTNFSDDTADQILCGAQAVAGAVGPNSNGSWTVGTYASRFITVAAGALPAESVVGGKRVRFLGNVTAALANACAMIQRISAGGAIVISNDLPGGSPVNGDEFVIEETGVRFLTLQLSGLVTDVDGFGATVGFSIVGFRFTSTTQGTSTVNPVTARFAFCEWAARTWFNGFNTLSMTRLYRYAASGPTSSIVVGGNRLEQGCVVSNGMSGTLFHTYHTGGAVAYSRLVGCGVGTGSCYATVTAQPTFLGCGIGTNGDTNWGVTMIFGRLTSTTSERAFSRGGVILGQCAMSIYGVDFAGVTSALIDVRGILDGANLVSFDDVIASEGGNTGVFLNTTRDKFGRYTFGAVVPFANPTTGGGILGAGNVRLNLDSLREVDFWDAAGNHYAGVGRVCAAQGALVLNGEGSTMAPGTIVRMVQAGYVRSSQGNATGSTWYTIGAVQNHAAPSGGPAMVVTSGLGLVQFTGTPTQPAIVYLDSTPGAAITTPPAGPNQKLRLGGVYETTTGPRAIVRLAIDNISVNADGSP